MKISKWSILPVALVAVASAAFPFAGALRRPTIAIFQTLRGRKTVADRIAQFGSPVHARLTPDFERAGVAYPPDRIVLVGLKDERLLELWVGDPPTLLKSYPILGASGSLGPKLKEGDRQVPEGLYRIASLNPNSLYHLSLRLNYPNAFDRTMGRRDGRENLGSDIMIHGKTRSVGCLAIGDEAVEELFVLAALTGLDNISVLLSPVDFRTRPLPESMPAVPPWTPTLYDSVRQELLKLQPSDWQLPVQLSPH